METSGAGLPDPTVPDAFERGAVLPGTVERHAVEMMAAGARALARLVLRVALALLVVELVVTIGRLAYASSASGFNGRVADGVLALVKRLDETRWLYAHLPGWVVMIIAVGLVLAIYVAGELADDLVGGIARTPGVAGSWVATQALDGATFVIDRAVAFGTRPLGRKGEAIARLGVMATSVGIAVLLLRWRPPSAWLAVWRFEPSIGLLATFARWAVLALAYGAVAFVVLVAVLQAPALVRLARYRRPGRIVSWQSEPGDASATRLAVVHWSDLHITPFADSLRTDRAQVGGNLALAGLAAEVAARGDAVDAIVITGDTTDAGRSAEWAQFFALAAPVLDKVVLVPGNHDLNIVDPLRWEIVGDAQGCGRALREVRLLAAMDRLQGDRTQVLDPGGTSLVPLRARLGNHAARLRAFYQRPSAEHAAAVHRLWRELFPMAVALPGGFHLIVFDSNDVAGNVVTNAFGRIDDAALLRFASLSRLLPAGGQLVAMHHQLGYPPGVHERELIARGMARGLVLQNARELVQTLLAADRGLEHVVVLHGHRHIGYEGRLDDRLDIVSARSSTIEDSYREQRQPACRRLLFQRVGARGTRLVGAETLAPAAAPAPPAASTREPDAVEDEDEDGDEDAEAHTDAEGEAEGLTSR